MARGTEIADLLSLGLFPKILLITRDQVDMLRTDNVVSPQAAADGRTLAGLGINAEAVEAVVPSYLYRFRKAGQYERTTPA
jgi:NADH dehydrogenase